jgi:hypothetical protein
MRKIIIALGSALGLVFAAHAADMPSMVVPIMKDLVAPNANILWDVGNRGMDDNGNADGSKLTAQDWAGLASAAQAMRDSAAAMAVPGVKVAPAGFKLDGEGSPGVATVRDIQAAIDKDPKGFAARTAELAEVSDLFLAAAKGKDAKRLFEASARLDTVCESCHTQYWYPKQ